MHRIKVLSASDEVTADILAAQLRDHQIDVSWAETCEKAINMVHHQYFDAHILESRFPDGDGFELCRLLKRCDPDTPVAFFTGDVSPQDRARGLGSGACAYLTKPFNGDIAAFVLELIRQRRRSSRNVARTIGN